MKSFTKTLGLFAHLRICQIKRVMEMHKQAISWKSGLTFSLISLMLLILGGWMLTANDVLTIVRGGIVFIAGFIGVTYFTLIVEWRYDKNSLTP